MPMDESSAKERLPLLLDWLDRASCLAKSMLSPRLKYRGDDDFAFMAVCFLSKQIDHATSLHVLSPLKDCVLVARTMVEGLCQLLWAARDTKVRPARWRAFAAVNDWRRLPHLKWQPSDEALARLHLALEECADLVLTKKAKAFRASGKELPADPYIKNWRNGTSITDIFRDVEAEELLDFTYSPYSAWAHWSSDSFADRLSGEEARVTYGPPMSALHAAWSAAVATPCLLQTAHLLASHLGLRQATAIDCLRDEFALWHNSLKNRHDDDA